MKNYPRNDSFLASKISDDAQAHLAWKRNMPLLTPYRAFWGAFFSALFVAGCARCSANSHGGTHISQVDGYAPAEEGVFSMPASRFRAVTVMHRPCSTLSFTLANFAGVLGTEWPLLILHDANISALRRRKQDGPRAQTTKEAPFFFAGRRRAFVKS